MLPGYNDVLVSKEIAKRWKCQQLRQAIEGVGFFNDAVFPVDVNPFITRIDQHFFDVIKGEKPEMCPIVDSPLAVGPGPFEDQTKQGCEVSDIGDAEDDDAVFF